MKAWQWSMVLGFSIALAPRAFGAASCDAGLALADLDPMSGAAALELCDLATGSTPGILSATYGATDFAVAFDQLPNSALGVGILDGFGPNVAPLRGTRMLALSTGTARRPSDPNFSSPSGFDKGYQSNFPVGLPIDSPACPIPLPGTPHDAAALRLVLKAPANARSFSFASKFYNHDFPTFVCSSFGDPFFALVEPAPGGIPNVAFDSQGNAISTISKEFLQVCDSQDTALGVYPCSLGTSELAGTGFDTPETHAATPWLYTSVPITPGSTITVTLGIYDASDGISDSTVLLDDFRWSTRTLAAPVTTLPEPSAAALAAAALVTLAWRGRRIP